MANKDEAEGAPPDPLAHVAMKRFPITSPKDKHRASWHDLAHVPVVDLTKLPPEDVEVEREAVEFLKALNRARKNKPHLN